MLVKVLSWIFSKAQDGKDIADRFIGAGKGQVCRWVKNGNDAATANDLCEALSSMTSLPGEHKTFVVQPTAAELEQEIPLKGEKGQIQNTSACTIRLYENSFSLGPVSGFHYRRK